MNNVRLIYKCRRCGVVFGSTSPALYGASEALGRLIAWMEMEGDESGFYKLHHCGGTGRNGIADLIGADDVAPSTEGEG